MDSHQYEYLTNVHWGDSVNQVNDTFQMNCTEENENVTVQCMVLDLANISSRRVAREGLRGLEHPL